MAITKATASSVAPAAKGDLVVGSATNDAAVLGVGSNDQVLTADSSTTTGLKWAAASSGGMTLINSGGTTLTGSSVNISSIPSTYNDLYVIINNFVPATTNQHLRFRFNNDTTANRHHYDPEWIDRRNTPFDDTAFYVTPQLSNTVSQQNLITILIPDYKNTTTWKFFQGMSLSNNPSTSTNFDRFPTNGAYNQTGAINRLDFFPTTGNFTSGTVYLYGVK